MKSKENHTGNVSGRAVGCSLSQSFRAMSDQSRAHTLPRSLALFSMSACFVASLNKSSTFSLYLAEHSKYSTAPRFLLASSPWTYVTAFWPDDRIFFIRSSSFRRSALHPARMMGTPLQKCCTSGNHYKTLKTISAKHELHNVCNEKVKMGGRLKV